MPLLIGLRNFKSCRINSAHQPPTHIVTSCAERIPLMDPPHGKSHAVNTLATLPANSIADTVKGVSSSAAADGETRRRGEAAHHRE
ncbi:hypothetical protein EVAR_12937_1 [Eumeta japonica]|uniref:Uncharacterized protein n=1 Tax=Eumeta variegata TaxID=151549 RepID=A0A4C1TW95_EUMVA|nr:hypothetical protein EVAR_12937_1 [Eumeta japonica]